jgi:predicted CXXCH cytochrome family protein
LLNTICAQCHSTPSPRWPSGAATRNASEALDFAGSACAVRARCVDCHDPHVAGPGAGAPDQPEQVAACVGCHQPLAAPDAARAHGRHDPAQVSCLDCHMPKIVQGVSEAVRSHRIGPPVDRGMLAAGAVNACNLCHLDRSITWTLFHLAQDFGRPLYAKAAWASAYDGRPGDPLGPIWLRSDDRARRLAAASAYARSPLGAAALGRLVAGLDHSVAFDRMWMLFAIEAVLGRPLGRAEYDPLAPAAERAQMARDLAAQLAPPR